MSAGTQQATRNPEWFVGGPWHGRHHSEDQRPVGGELRAPYAPDVAVKEPNPAVGPRECRYVRRRLPIGWITLTFWADNDLDELGALTRLAEILLAPHKVPG